MYYNNQLLRLLNQNDLSNINNYINEVNNNISTQINNSIVYGSIIQSGGNERTINVGKAYRYCILTATRIIYSLGNENMSGGIIFEPNASNNQYIGLGMGNIRVYAENNTSFNLYGSDNMDRIYVNFIAFT